MVSVGKGILNSEVIKNTAARIRKMNDGRVPDPSLEFITCSEALAHHGLLGAVDYVTLVDVDRDKLVDLSTIPAHHLVSLISSATRGVMIDHVTGCDLVSLIDSLKCKKLTIILLRTLGMEETQALLRAMESRVEVVDLSLVEIDIEALTKYSGQGSCLEIKCYTLDKFFKELEAWASRTNWLLQSTTKEFVDEDKIRWSYKEVDLLANLPR